MNDIFFVKKILLLVSLNQRKSLTLSIEQPPEYTSLIILTADIWLKDSSRSHNLKFYLLLWKIQHTTTTFSSL
ncbi:uncharacterized protein OCT59_003068 [Rhizophagus irregularis]|uniref:uncharacterized protein n=1 Tax=Rhizophagus irregularis TaxID=588596 RepID=UPI0033166456|nr:hypothetical protein OCT59_003068 [Rhizophagus irregularis]